jgi:hypothetical protein
MKRNLSRPYFLWPVLAAFLALAVQPAGAAVQQRVHGSIESVAADDMVVADRSGVRVEVQLRDPLTVQTIAPLDQSAIVAGRVLSVVATQGLDGSLQASQVLVLPDAMAAGRDNGIVWTLQSDEVAVRGRLVGEEKRDGVRQLTLSTRDGTSIVYVQPKTQVATFTPAERSDLKAGTTVFLVGMTTQDGGVQTSRVVVTKEGSAAPE